MAIFVHFILQKSALFSPTFNRTHSCRVHPEVVGDREFCKRRSHSVVYSTAKQYVTVLFEFTGRQTGSRGSARLLVFQGGALGLLPGLPIWKSATRQVWKPAPQGRGLPLQQLRDARQPLRPPAKSADRYPSPCIRFSVPPLFGVRWQSAAATPLSAGTSATKRCGASLPTALQMVKRAFSQVVIHYFLN